MSLGGAIAVAFLAIMVVLVLRGVGGHVRSGKADEAPDTTAFPLDGDAPGGD